MVAKQRNNATASIKGIIFQFLIALEKCFQLQEGEKVYIETHGDVSVFKNESEQIEVKFFTRDLTTMDTNVWNTIYNWMQADFDMESFKSLILLTTQNIKDSSVVWYDWNNTAFLRKYTSLKKIYEDYIQKEAFNNNLKEKLDYIFAPENEQRFKKVLKKFTLDHCNKNPEAQYKKIKDIYAKPVHAIQGDTYIRSLLGYIISPEIVDNNWTITYDNFTKTASELAQALVEKTTIFPAKKTVTTINPDDFIHNPFVKKIHEIEYAEEVPKAVEDYIYTKQMLVEEIRSSHCISKSYQEYEKGIEDLHSRKYKIACRNCKSEDSIIYQSQNFYDEMMSNNMNGTFYSYNSLPLYFNKGVLHILAEEEKKNIKWLIEKRI